MAFVLAINGGTRAVEVVSTAAGMAQAEDINIPGAVPSANNGDGGAVKGRKSGTTSLRLPMVDWSKRSTVRGMS